MNGLLLTVCLVSLRVCIFEFTSQECFILQMIFESAVDGVLHFQWTLVQIEQPSQIDN